jgi:hypothetical protein
VISKKGRGGRRYLPYVFTEQGVAMLSSILRSERAVQVNIEIMRAFVRLREMIATHKNLACKLEALEKKYDVQFNFLLLTVKRQFLEIPLAILIVAVNRLAVIDPANDVIDRPQGILLLAPESSCR